MSVQTLANDWQGYRCEVNLASCTLLVVIALRVCSCLSDHKMNVLSVTSSALLPHLRQTLPALSQYACKQWDSLLHYLNLSVCICTTTTSQTHKVLNAITSVSKPSPWSTIHLQLLNPNVSSLYCKQSNTGQRKSLGTSLECLVIVTTTKQSGLQTLIQFGIQHIFSY